MYRSLVSCIDLSSRLRDCRTCVGDRPGLGVTSPDLPTVFDASSCIAVPIIEKALVAARGEMPVDDLVQLLKYEYGLTQTLALFYVMVFVRHMRAEARLKTGHQIESSRGGPFLSDRITWDLVPEVVFSESLLDHLGTIRLQPATAWNSVLPYATLLLFFCWHIPVCPSTTETSLARSRPKTS